MDGDHKPKRRERYKGTHPRKFHEKYKELNPERYAQDVQKIMERGSTPVGTHRPICLTEILNILKPQPGDMVVDATLGYGGHSKALLEKIIPGGKLIAFDQDPIERPKTEERLKKYLESIGEAESVLTVGGVNFSKAWNFLRSQGLSSVNHVLADLGLSSMQIDTPERGFSFKVDAPFDLRMNPQTGKPAAELLKELSVQEIAQLLIDNADEPHAEQIAASLFKDQPQTTFQVAESVEKVMSHWSAKVREREGDTPIRRTFQAFRIAVNDEYGALEQFLEDIPRYLRPGGRVAILSFHSGEDRRVKKSFQRFEREGIYSEISSEPIRPSYEEQRSNPRSSSAKLRWAIR